MKTETIRLALKIEVEIDGRAPDDLRQLVIAALNTAMPSVLLDEEDMGMMLFTKSWAWT